MRRFTPLAASPAIDNYWIGGNAADRCYRQDKTPPALTVAGGLALGRFALTGDGIFGRPAHQRRIIMAEQDLAEADRRLDLHLPVGAPFGVAAAQRLHQPLGRSLDVMLQVGIGPQRDLVDCEFAGI